MCPSNFAFQDIPFIYLDIINTARRDRTPVVCIAYGDEMSVYVKPLTPRGCAEVGRWLSSRGFSRWLYSSSVDFPKDVRPGIKFDPKYYIESPEEE